MAISKTDCTILFYSKKLGVLYTDTLMLDRLNLYATYADIVASILKYKTNEKEIDDVLFKDEYSEPRKAHTIVLIC
jgi:hypothetical protein